MYRLIPFAFIILSSLFLASWNGDSFFPGQLIEPSHWKVESHTETISPNKGRKSQIKNGGLHIGYYAFGRADTLIWAGKPLQNLQLTLHPDSTPIQVEVIAQKRYKVEVTPTAWRHIDQEQWKNYTAPWNASQITPSPIQLEITTLHSNSKLSLLEADEIIIDYSSQQKQPFLLASFLGILISISFLQISSGWLLRAIVLTPLTIPLYTHWTFLIESLRLTQTEDWELARITLIASCIPSIFVIMNSVVTKKRLPYPTVIWFGAFGLCLLFTKFNMLSVLLGSTILLSHIILVIRRKFDSELWLWDAPLMLLPIFCGWGLGLLLVLLFRWVLFFSHLKHFLQNCPKASSDQAFLMIILLPFTVEWSLRDTYLYTTWSPKALEGQQEDWYDWTNPLPYWQAQCGDQTQAKGLLYVGGSSTGGAYQFADDPDAFFAGQLHNSLCQNNSIHSHNYGNSDRDTHTISRTITQMLDATNADVIVLYVGHNDFGGNNPYTRKERETRENSTLVSIGKKARNLRFIAGFDLMFRQLNSSPKAQLDGPPLGPDGQVLDTQIMDQTYPYAVPLEDAQQNLWDIANIASKRGVKCVLVAQFISRNSFADLTDYWVMEKQLAEAHPNIWFIDPRKILDIKGEESILVDNNHLSREGHKQLANVLYKQLEALLTK
jgi:lysophospholipase L1-like esterase